MSSFFRKNREQDQPRWQKKQTAINSQNDRFTIYAHMQPQKCKQAHEYQKSSQFSQNFSCIQKRNNDDDPVIHCKVNKMKQTLKSFQVLNDSQYRLQNISRKNEYPNRSSQLPSNQSSIQRSNKNLQSTQQRAQKNVGYYPQKIQTQQNEQNNEQLQDQIQQNYNKQINYNAKLDQMQYRLSMICQKQQQNKFDQLIANPDAYTNPNTNANANANTNTNTNKYSRSPYSQYSHHNSQQSTKRQQFKTKKSSEYSYSGKHIIKQLKAEKQAKNNRNLNIQKSKNTVPIPTIIHEDDQEMDLQNVKIASTMQVHPYGKKNYADIFQDSRKNSPYPTNNANINKNRSYQLEKDMKNKSRQYLNADQDGGRSQGGAWKIQLMRQSRQNAHTGTGNNRYRQQNQLYSNNSESIANEQQQKSHKKSTSTNLHGKPNPNPNSNNNYNISHSHSLSNSHAHINPSKYSIADMDIDREREKYGQRHMETGTWAKEEYREWSQADYKQNFNQYNHMEQLTTKRKELAQRITYLDKNTSKHQQQTKQKYNYSQNRNSSKTNKSQKSINKSIQKLHNSTSSNKQAIQKKSNSNSFNNLKNQKSNSTSKPISKQKPQITHQVIYVQPHHLPLQSKNPKINHITFSNNRSSVSQAPMAPKWHKAHRGPIVQVLFLSQYQFVTASTDYSIQFHHIQIQIQNQNQNNISSSTLYRHRSAINSIVNIDNTIYSVSNDMYLKKCTIELSSNLHGTGQGQMHDQDMYRMEQRPLHLLAIDQMNIMIGCINKLYVFDVANWNIVTDIPIQVSVGQEYRLLGNGHQIYVADTQLIAIGQFGDRRAGRNVPIKLGIDYGNKDEDNGNVKWIMHQTQDICYRIINNKFYKVDFKNKSPSPFPSQPSLQIPLSQKMISHCWPQTQSPMPMLTVLTHQHMQTNIIKNRLLQLNLQTNSIQQIYTNINNNTNMDDNGQDIDCITGMHNAFNIVRESGGIYFIGDKSGRIVTISSGKYRDGNSGAKGAIKNRQRVNTYL